MPRPASSSPRPAPTPHPPLLPPEEIAGGGGVEAGGGFEAGGGEIDAGAIVIVNVAVPSIDTLDAEITTGVTPVAVGVPVIIPVAVLQARPAGRPVAP